MYYIANTLASKHSKMPPNAISEHLIFKIFREEHTPDPYHWQAMHSDCALCSN